MDFNMNDLELNNMVDEEVNDIDLSNYVDNTVIEYPHIKVDTKDFNNMLKVAKTVISPGSKDLVSKSICLKVENGQLNAYCTDFDVYAQYNMVLQNTEKVLDEPIIFPVQVMLKLMRAVPSSLVIFKDSEGFKVQLMGGSIPLETYAMKGDKHCFEDEMVESEVSTMGASSLLTLINDFSNIVSSAISPAEKRIIVGENANATYLYANIRSIGKYPTMDLKLRDIATLKLLLSHKDENLLFYDTKDSSKSTRKIIKGEKFTLAFLVGEARPNKIMQEMLKEVNTEKGLHIDFLQLYKIVELSTELPYSLGEIGLNYNADGKLELLFKTKRGKDNVFTLDGTVEGNIIQLANPIVVKAKFLKVLMSAFTKESSIKIVLNDNALSIVNNSYTGTLFVDN